MANRDEAPVRQLGLYNTNPKKKELPGYMQQTASSVIYTQADAAKRPNMRTKSAPGWGTGTA